MTVIIDVPPNPLLGGTIIAIAEQLLISSKSGTVVNLNLSDEIFHTHPEIVDILEGILQCEGVIIESLKHQIIGEVCGRFESPIGLANLAGSRVIRSLIRFRIETINSALTKIRNAHIYKFIAFHGNISNNGDWGSSMLAPKEALELAAVIQELQPTFSVIIVGADSRYLAGESLPAGIKLGSELGLSVREQMALIQIAHAFVGMSSGPSVFATMSETPYVIIKNFRHHADLVKQMLREGNRLAFASKHQEFFVARGTFQSDLPGILKRVSKLVRDDHLTKESR